MLFPKKIKHRKWQTDRRNQNKTLPADTRGVTLSYGAYGIKALGISRIKSNQIEAARKVLSRNAGKTGKVWIRIFPDRPYTSKGSEVGMGKGKGDQEGYV